MTREDKIRKVLGIVNKKKYWPGMWHGEGTAELAEAVRYLAQVIEEDYESRHDIAERWEE